MAPAINSVNMLHAMYGRQTNVPVCVTTCMASGDLGSCASLADLACLCTSPTYASSVGTCWAANCAPEEVAAGQVYSADMCAAFLGNSTETNTTAPAETSIVSTGVPVLYHKAFINVQAIMSSICAALLLTAIVLGFLACRNRIRRDREAAQRATWTGVGTYAGGADSRGGKSQMFSRPGPSSTTFTNNHNFGVTSSSFGGTTLNDPHMPTFNLGQAPSYSVNRAPFNGERISVNRPANNGFTNRLTMNDNENEAYEMAVKHSPDSPSKDSIDDMADTPTTMNTRIGDSTINLGSTAELTPKLSYNRGGSI